MNWGAIFMSIFVLVFLLAVVVVVGAGAYLKILFEDDINEESVTEALYYAAQTVTTVGYGNWIPEWIDPDEDKTRVLTLKKISIIFMLLGGGLFGFLVGYMSNVVSNVVLDRPR